jgi:heterodisulfide reductase subunit A-like polyferredoxin
MYSSISPSQINKPHSTYKRYKSGRIVVIGGGITGLQRKIPPK